MTHAAILIESIHCKIFDYFTIFSVCLNRFKNKRSVLFLAAVFNKRKVISGMMMKKIFCNMIKRFRIICRHSVLIIYRKKITASQFNQTVERRHYLLHCIGGKRISFNMLDFYNAFVSFKKLVFVASYCIHIVQKPECRNDVNRL